MPQCESRRRYEPPPAARLAAGRAAAFDLFPPQGLSIGGTNVTLRGGDGLGGGLSYACRFGYAVVPATYDASVGGVQCTSPHAHLALAPPLAPEPHTFYGDVSRERSGDGARMLTFSEVPEGANGTAAAAADAVVEGGGDAAGGANPAGLPPVKEEKGKGEEEEEDDEEEEEKEEKKEEEEEEG